MEDPDASGGTFVHWSLFGIPPGVMAGVYLAEYPRTRFAQLDRVEREASRHGVERKLATADRQRLAAVRRVERLPVHAPAPQVHVGDAVAAQVPGPIVGALKATVRSCPR